jgi:hypothetical protein
MSELLGDNPDLGSAVLLFSACGAVIGYGLSISIAFGLHTLRRDVLLLKILLHRICAVFGKCLIGFGRANIVGMPGNLDDEVWFQGHVFSQLIEFFIGFASQGRFPAVEEDIVESEYARRTSNLFQYGISAYGRINCFYPLLHLPGVWQKAVADG